MLRATIKVNLNRKDLSHLQNIISEEIIQKLQNLNPVEKAETVIKNKQPIVIITLSQAPITLKIIKHNDKLYITDDYSTSHYLNLKLNLEETTSLSQQFHAQVFNDRPYATTQFVIHSVDYTDENETIRQIQPIITTINHLLQEERQNVK